MRVRVGRYETVRPIASGGMATVYLGRALGAGGFERLVGIKMMHPHIAGDPEFVSMFLDEARLAARVRHPNVVATIDVQDSPAGLFLVMEYVEGPSLAKLVRALAKRRAGLSIGAALRIVIDGLFGLHAAHEQKGPTGAPLQLVHRDVSPQNLLVGADGATKVTDFGVARAESRLSSTRGQQIKGKISYMAPEQMMAAPIDRRADVFSAGVVLWELLAGKRLFTGENDAAIMRTVLSGVPRSLRESDPLMPAALDAACLRALQPDPAERYPTALAFAEALEVAAADSGVPIATSRMIAEIVKDAGAHEPPPETWESPVGTPVVEEASVGPTTSAQPKDSTVANPGARRGAFGRMSNGAKWISVAAVTVGLSLCAAISVSVLRGPSPLTPATAGEANAREPVEKNANVAPSPASVTPSVAVSATSASASVAPIAPKSPPRSTHQAGARSAPVPAPTTQAFRPSGL